MAVTGINYEEPIPKTYESVDIQYGDGMKEKKVFASGNFVRDWWNVKKFMIQNLLDSEHAFCHSSSVDHFIMDGAPYDSAYLRTDDKGMPYFQYEYTEDSIEFFVPKGTKPTWEELKELYK